MKYSAAAERTWKFQFLSTDGTTREETYRADDRRGGAGTKEGGARKGGDGKISTPQDEARPRDQGRGSSSVEFTPKRTGNFSLRSSAVAADGVLPVEFTGDGASISPPLEWSGAPAGTAAYAVIMHHIDPAGLTKWYWTLYNIPADAHGLPKDAQGIGTAGSNSINRRIGYAPPQSKGPGAKTYVVTAYALSEPLLIATPPGNVDRAALLAQIERGQAIRRSRRRKTSEPTVPGAPMCRV